MLRWWRGETSPPREKEDVKGEREEMVENYIPVLFCSYSAFICAAYVAFAAGVPGLGSTFVPSIDIASY